MLACRAPAKGTGTRCELASEGKPVVGGNFNLPRVEAIGPKALPYLPVLLLARNFRRVAQLLGCGAIAASRRH